MQLITTTAHVKTLKQSKEIAGNVQKGNSKILGSTFNLPTQYCNVGSKLKQITGSVCSDCYAVKIEKGIHGKTVLSSELNNYEKWQNTVKNDSYALWINAMTKQIENIARLKQKKNEKGAMLHRWFSSGDLQGITMLECIVEIAKKTPTIQHWLPTKEKIVVENYIRKYGKFPKNLNVRVSDSMIDGKQNKENLNYTRSSVLGRKSNKNDSHLKGYHCPVAFNKDRKSCGDCSACWNKDVSYIIYKQH